MRTLPNPLTPLRLAFLGALVLCAAAAALVIHSHHGARGDGNVVLVVSGSGPPTTHPRTSGRPAAASVRDAEEAQAFPDPAAAARHAHARAPRTNAASTTKGISPGAPSDAEVRRELRELERGSAGGAGLAGVPGGAARLAANGLAEAPLGAPDVVAHVISGGNAIAKFPYVLGGGHGSFSDGGYDCSGSVSYALAAGALLHRPLASGEFAHWGARGRGRWITIYANAGHVYMYVAGLRFDTSGRSGPRGSRWQTAPRSGRGFVVRHPPGL
jgi:cell wall-associated NlpC family hydrolase